MGFEFEVSWKIWIRCCFTLSLVHAVLVLYQQIIYWFYVVFAFLFFFFGVVNIFVMIMLHSLLSRLCSWCCFICRCHFCGLCTWNILCHHMHLDSLHTWSMLKWEWCVFVWCHLLSWYNSFISFPMIFVDLVNLTHRCYSSFFFYSLFS